MGQTSYYKKFLVDGGTVEDAIYKNRDKRFKLLSFTTDVLISLIGCGFVREVIFIILLKRQNSGECRYQDMFIGNAFMKPNVC